jgi:hypothetical protein
LIGASAGGSEKESGMPLPGNIERVFGPDEAAKISPWNEGALAALGATRTIAWRQAICLRPEQSRAIDHVIDEIGVYQIVANPALNPLGLLGEIRPRLCELQREAVVAAVAALNRAGAAIWWRTVHDGRVELLFVPIRTPAR